MPDLGDFLNCHGGVGIAPAIAHVGQHVGDLFVRQVRQCDHGAVVGFAIDDNLTAAARDHAANDVVLVFGGEKVRVRQRRNLPGRPWPLGWWQTKQVCIKTPLPF